MKLKEWRERISEKWKRLISDLKLIAKPALITTAIVAGVAGMIFLVAIMIPKENISDFLKRWENVVESGDGQAYAEICSKEFKGLDYEEIKNRVAGKGIDVDIEDKDIEKVRLDDNHYVIKHIPVFLSKDNIRTHEELNIRRKGLIDRRWEIDHEGYYFSKANGEKLKQIAEGKPPEPLVEPGKAPRDTEYVIRQILEVWRTAWENKNLDRYMDCYADYADITRVTVVGGKEKRTRLTKSALRDHMARLNDRYSKIRVDFSEPVEIEGDVAIAKANFLQEYRAWIHLAKGPVYHDIGTKELQFLKHLDWKITNENWTLYKEVPVYPKRKY